MNSRLLDPHIGKVVELHLAGGVKLTGTLCKHDGENNVIYTIETPRLVYYVEQPEIRALGVYQPSAMF